MTEIKLFNEWLETNELSTAGISLWYGLMFIANRSGWKPNLSIPISTIMVRTKMSRSAIYRERNSLQSHGLIEFDMNEGRQSSNYRIRSFEKGIMSQVTFPTGMQSETQSPEPSHVVCHPETQNGTQTDVVSLVASHRETQNETETDVAYHTGTQGGSIYKHKQSLHIIEKDEKTSQSKKKEKIDLSFIVDTEWRSLIEAWLNYKESRKEGYKSSLSAQKFLTMLKNLCGGDIKLAQKIIDKSIARNWAGIFELSEGDIPTTSKPASGQRIGQIIQPETDEKRAKFLKKFESKK